MAMNNKGMFFTLMAIIFLFVIVALILLPTHYELSSHMLRVESRVLSMDNFISDVQRDTERGLYISSYRALLSLESRLIDHGSFLSNMSTLFQEALLNGTLYQAPSPIMTGSTFPLWIEKIQAEGKNMNIDVNLTIKNIIITQDDPWRVKVSASLLFYLNDTAGTAYWNRNETINTSISIIGFEDPFYIVYSFGRITNIINMTSFDGNFTFYNGTAWDMGNFIAHAEQSFYTTNPLAPSFLMRLEGNMSSSPYGIESMVNLTKIANTGLVLDTTSSIVDYHYWNQSNNGAYRINKTPAWIRLDNAHLARYNLTNLAYES